MNIIFSTKKIHHTIVTSKLSAWRATLKKKTCKYLSWSIIFNRSHYPKGNFINFAILQINTCKINIKCLHVQDQNSKTETAHNKKIIKWQYSIQSKTIRHEYLVAKSPIAVAKTSQPKLLLQFNPMMLGSFTVGQVCIAIPKSSETEAKKIGTSL